MHVQLRSFHPLSTSREEKYQALSTCKLQCLPSGAEEPENEAILTYFLAPLPLSLMHGCHFWYSSWVKCCNLASSPLPSMQGPSNSVEYKNITGSPAQSKVSTHSLQNKCICTYCISLNRCHPQIVAAQKWAVKKIVAAVSDWRNTVHSGSFLVLNLKYLS